MDSSFNSIRFKLFTQSYSGLILANYLNSSLDQETEVRKVARVLLFKEFKLRRFILSNQYRKQLSRINVQYKRVDTLKISVYLQIERELYNLQQLRKDKAKFREFEYDNGNMLLELAIERVAGSRLRNIKNDAMFDQELPRLMKVYRHWYYTVAYTYKLPTVRILPFILRLITS